jgi:hypothetical protein
MPVTLPYAPTRVSGAGVTICPFAWGAAAAAHVVVQKVSTAGAVTTLTNGVHYSIVVGQAGGAVTLVTPLAADESILLSRVTPITQPASYRNQKQLRLVDIEGSYDRLTYIAQEQTYAAQVLAGQGLGTVAPRYTSATLPPASEALQGMVVRVKDVGAAEVVKQCLQNADGSWDWQGLFTGGI